MKWKVPPIIKIYEALGAVADDRITVSKNTAKVFSSSGNKCYDVSYNPEKHAIASNDNGSYWKGYLGYPSIALLLKMGALEYKPEVACLIQGIRWKDVNQKFKNDFDKTLRYIGDSLDSDQRRILVDYVSRLAKKIQELDLRAFGRKTLPPKGY